MKMITLYLPQPYIDALDQLVQERFFPNRAEAMRGAIRDLLVDFSKFSAVTSYRGPGVSERERGCPCM